MVPMLALSTLALASCGENSDEKVPSKICGTTINAQYVRPLLKDSGKFSEFSRLDNARARTAPCDLMIDDQPVMSFRFAWSPTSVDIMKYATSDSSVSSLREPRQTGGEYQTVIGDDGAISTAACRKSDASYFTLTLLLPRSSKYDSGPRADIKKFMGVYMKEAMKGFKCGGARSGG
ncbi:hypothetical protein ACFVYR_10795 [Streptomyces sp. NPDC058284]|uniref:hypothetical protein n=1 Tax=unclassified Streptomyces TaxID=2593676 RepID=UPI0036675A0A